MNDKAAIREATTDWINTFSRVPGSVIRKLAACDEAVHVYDSDTFRLIAGPSVQCGDCGYVNDGSETLADVTELEARGSGVVCTNCDQNQGAGWHTAVPEYAFPCGWDTLFTPGDGCDQWWMREHADEVARLGFYVFDSEDFGIILGIDAGGFDFFGAYWMPLYGLRGLQWHRLG